MLSNLIFFKIFVLPNTTKLSFTEILYLQNVQKLSLVKVRLIISSNLFAKLIRYSYKNDMFRKVGRVHLFRNLALHFILKIIHKSWKSAWCKLYSLQFWTVFRKICTCIFRAILLPALEVTKILIYFSVKFSKLQKNFFLANIHLAF